MPLYIGGLCPTVNFSGVAVTVTGTGYSQTHTTSSLGVASFTGIVVGNTYSVSYTPPSPYASPRWVQGPTSFTPTSTSYSFSSGWNANTAAGYVCNCGCNIPISNVLNMVAYIGSYTVPTDIVMTPGTPMGSYVGLTPCSSYVGTYVGNGTNGDSGTTYQQVFQYDTSTSKFLSFGLNTVGGGGGMALIYEGAAADCSPLTCNPFFRQHCFDFGTSTFIDWQITEGTPIPP